MKTMRYMTVGKCFACKLRTSVLVTEEQRKAFDLHLAFPSSRPNPNCGLVKDPAGGIGVACRGCGSRMYAKRVMGKLKPDHKCDAQCLSATGHSCECACGGKNHGAAHAA